MITVQNGRTVVHDKSHDSCQSTELPPAMTRASFDTKVRPITSATAHVDRIRTSTRCDNWTRRPNWYSTKAGADGSLKAQSALGTGRVSMHHQIPAFRVAPWNVAGHCRTGNSEVLNRSLSRLSNRVRQESAQYASLVARARFEDIERHTLSLSSTLGHQRTFNESKSRLPSVGMAIGGMPIGYSDCVKRSNRPVSDMGPLRSAQIVLADGRRVATIRTGWGQDGIWGS